MTMVLEREQETASPAAPPDVRPPTAEEIDESLAEYESARRLHHAAREVLDVHKGRLIFLADSFGHVPPHAEQSKRLEGKLHTLTVTRGTAITVADPAVLELHLALEHVGRADIFARLFTVHTKHKLVEARASFCARWRCRSACTRRCCRSSGSASRSRRTRRA